MKNKFKSYSFWMSVTAGVILVLNNMGKAFGFVVESEIVTEIVDSICGVLILFGVLSMQKNEKQQDENQVKTINNNQNKETLKEVNNKIDIEEQNKSN